MAPKRKAEEMPAGLKKSTKEERERATKKPRQDTKAAKVVTTTSHKATNPQAKEIAVPALVTSSILQQEERAFPRGGGSVLTPLEQKQIQLQATRDVLFEESGHKKVSDVLDGSDDDAMLGDDVVTEEKLNKKRKRTKGQEVSTEKPESKLRIEGLKFKRLSPGSLVLGQITRLTSDEVTLDLPNNLTGVVPITGISKILTKKLEVLAKTEEDDSQEEDESRKARDIKTEDIFRVGDYLRGYVLSTTDESSHSGKGRKRIELSLEPELANHGLSHADLCVNCMVQASVASVEDRGLIMQLGIDSGKTTGFLAKTDIPAGLEFGSIHEGAVFLCMVTRYDVKSRVVGLTANYGKAGASAKTLQNAPTVNSLLPGCAVDLLISQVTSSGLVGTVMGSVKASADIVHSGAGARHTDIETKYKVGSKVKARIIFSLGDTEAETIGVSLLDHVLSVSSKGTPDGETAPSSLKGLRIGATLEQAKVLNVESGLGLYVDVGVKGFAGFVHISRISDNRVESLSQSTGPYRSGTSHRARIIGWNAVDLLFLVSLEKSVLQQTYLRVEDVPIGEIVEAKVEKLLLGANGINGVILNIAQGISGLVPEKHMSDVQLQHPERKFKEGVSVIARVLSTDLEKRQIRLTLKKSLVNSDLPIWSDYRIIHPGSESQGTITKLTAHGAIVQFFGRVRAFLPVKEMSDTFIQDPASHFRLGQVVRVHAVSVDAVEGRLTVSCRLAHGDATQSATLAKIKPGDLLNATVSAKTDASVTVELSNMGLIATLRIGHLTDGSEQKNAAALKRIRTGQKLDELLVLETFEKKGSIVMSQKPSLVRAAKACRLITKFDDIKSETTIEGFVRNVTADAVFVGFAGGITGLLHKSNISEELVNLPEFGMLRDKSISCRISSVDPTQQRFALSMKEKVGVAPTEADAKSVVNQMIDRALINPIDKDLHSLNDLQLGRVTKAQITSVKDTQLNVKLADHVSGRVDVSELFGNWEAIADRKNPLRPFKVSQVISVKILGMHDARNHRFLPISHRIGKVPVYELSAKLEENQSITSLDQVKVDSWYTGFVNGTTDMCIWLNLSPNVRGRIERLHISEDVSALNDLARSFPMGSAIRVRAIAVDPASNRLDLSAKEPSSDIPLKFEDVSPGMITPGRVTKSSEKGVVVQLSGTVVGHIGLTELSDDFAEADPTKYAKNGIVRVKVVEVDKPNKRLTLSARPSMVLSSSLPVKDAFYTDIAQLHVNDVVRGFIKNVADMGIFVSLSYSLTAFVRVSELTDDFVKDWKQNFEINRLVTGKVIAIDETSKRVQLSLKPSVVSKDHVPQKSFNDFKVGDIVTGTIRKVEEFGAFVVIDDSHNVSGLAHRSEMAEERIEDARTLYSEGDAVKAIVLNVEPEKRRIAFGLKAAYFQDLDDEDEDFDDDDENVDDVEDEDDDEDDSGVVLDAAEDSDNEEAGEDEDVDADGLDGGVNLDIERVKPISTSQAQLSSDLPITIQGDAEDGLDVGGFNWSGERPASDNETPNNPSSNLPTSAPLKKKKNKSTIQTDQTGDLDKYGPRTTTDFERLLLSQPNSSSLWVQYMAFHLQLSDIDEARRIAERAIKTIHIREQDEKLDVWTAWLNLENAYGSEETLERVFKEACAVGDEVVLGERLASILIGSGKNEQASTLFSTLLRKKSFTTTPKFWLNYATFLFDTLSTPAAARSLLSRALQSVPAHLHRDLTVSFAALEFKCRNGDAERGRTMFETLCETWPKRWDVWDRWVELEMGSNGTANVNVRALYERMAGMGMKKKRANLLFKKWLKFEEEHGGTEKQRDHVKARAAEWVEKHKDRAQVVEE